jgi:hypothetical protein
MIPDAKIEKLQLEISRLHDSNVKLRAQLHSWRHFIRMVAASAKGDWYNLKTQAAEELKWTSK